MTNKPLTVAELIEQLQKMPQDAEVWQEDLVYYLLADRTGGCVYNEDNNTVTLVTDASL